MRIIKFRGKDCKNGKWEWEAWKENYLYWMPIPKFPKE